MAIRDLFSGLHGVGDFFDEAVDVDVVVADAVHLRKPHSLILATPAPRIKSCGGGASSDKARCDTPRSRSPIAPDQRRGRRNAPQLQIQPRCAPPAPALWGDGSMHAPCSRILGLTPPR